MIEKQIHFIWLGNEKIPDEIKAYMKTWSLLEEEGFQVHRWDESNVNMEDVPPVIEAAMKYKKYAFVSDHLRLKILYENGGIYLDTDVEVRKDISDTFDEKTTLLLGFIYDTLIGTAVIGARKGEPLIFELMKLYEKPYVRTWCSIVKGFFLRRLGLLGYTDQLPSPSEIWITSSTVPLPFSRTAK